VLCPIEVFRSDDQIDITHGPERRMGVHSGRENNTFGPDRRQLCLTKCLCQSRYLHLPELAQPRTVQVKPLKALSRFLGQVIEAPVTLQTVVKEWPDAI
jgi:hypothetical protein